MSGQNQTQTGPKYEVNENGELVFRCGDVVFYVGPRHIRLCPPKSKTCFIYEASAYGGWAYNFWLDATGRKRKREEGHERR